MSKFAVRKLSLIAIFVASIAPPALAADENATTRVGGANGWDGFAYSEGNAKVCYLVGTPQKSDPAGAKRGRIDAYVTHRPAEKTWNVVHFDFGVALKPDSPAMADIDGHKFPLFTAKDAAWNADAAGDKVMTEALMRGNRAIISATPAKGAELHDTYSLAGFTDALTAIDKACGLKR